MMKPKRHPDPFGVVAAQLAQALAIPEERAREVLVELARGVDSRMWQAVWRTAQAPDE